MRDSFQSFQSEDRENLRNVSVSYSNAAQVSIIRREFVDLTGNHFSAVILNQLLYWTERVRDFDLLLEEERTFHPECNVSPRHGWIYKTANDLNEETMLGISPPTMRKYLKQLIEQGWIDERTHPMDKWNKTTQYRVNLRKLQEDLIVIGRSLPNIYLRSFSSSLMKENFSEKIPETSSEETQNVKNLYSNENSSILSPVSKEIPNERNLNSNERNFDSDIKNFGSNKRNFGSYTYTENTPENKSKEHTAREIFDETRGQDFFIELLKIWKRHTGQEVHLTDDRKHKLQSLLETHFQSDLSQWEHLCERIKASPFLMGNGPRKWRVSLDWILLRGNLLKILEGNFDNHKVLGQKKAEEVQRTRDQAIEETLASIENPTWRKWCTDLIFPPLLNAQGLRRAPISLFDLQGIANARFDESEGRIIWIASQDKRVLSRIYSLQFNILNVAQSDFPKASSIQTRLKDRASSMENQTHFETSYQNFQGKTNPPFNTNSTTGEHIHE